MSVHVENVSAVTHTHTDVSRSKSMSKEAKAVVEDERKNSDTDEREFLINWGEFQACEFFMVCRFHVVNVLCFGMSELFEF